MGIFRGTLTCLIQARARRRKRPLDIEVPDKTYREDHRRLKKSRRAFEKAAREKEALEQ